MNIIKIIFKNSRYIILILYIISLLYSNSNNKEVVLTSSKEPYNNTNCVTFSNLRFYNYTELFDYYDSSFIFPENYCYGVLSYNITIDDFNNIRELNIKAFKLYRYFYNLFLAYNNMANAISMNNGCLPYFRNVACYSVFNSCVDKGEYNDNNKENYKTNGICSDVCSIYNNRCGNFAINEGICNNMSYEYYCAGVNNYNYLRYYSFIIIIIVFINVV